MPCGQSATTGSGMRRRDLILAAAGLAATPKLVAVEYAAVSPRPLVFPRDHGAHPEFRSEWWYLTGWLDGPAGDSIGFQVTFFRFRTPVAPSASPFSPEQLFNPP